MANTRFIFGVATTEERLHKSMVALGVQEEVWPEFDLDGIQTAYFVRDDDQQRLVVAIVCIPINKDVSGIEIASSIVHQAVCIWQHHCGINKRKNRSAELEANSIQYISRELMTQYNIQRNEA